MEKEMINLKTGFFTTILSKFLKNILAKNGYAGIEPMIESLSFATAKDDDNVTARIALNITGKKNAILKIINDMK